MHLSCTDYKTLFYHQLLLLKPGKDSEMLDCV